MGAAVDCNYRFTPTMVCFCMVDRNGQHTEADQALADCASTTITQAIGFCVSKEI